MTKPVTQPPAEKETAMSVLAELRDIAKAGIKPNDKPNTVVFPDGFVIEGRAADEWIGFLRLVIEVADKALCTPSPQTKVMGDNQPRYTTKRLHDEIDKARAYGLEMAAQLIVDNIIQDTSHGKVLVPRQEGNQDGLHYAAEIRHLAAPVDAKERKE
jgi:hypothetical protein